MLIGYPDVLTTDEVCEILRIGYNTLSELLVSGRLKAYKHSRVWRIPKQALIEFIMEEAKLK